MKTQREISAEDFNRFLAWLDADRDQAGQKYEDLRRGLIVIFTCRGCHVPEELADETINRVIRRLPKMIEIYQGDPAPYLYTVAHNLFLEHNSKQSHLTSLPPGYDPPSLSQEPDDGREDECLERCLETLTPNNRRLVLQYYQEEKQAKIDHRKRLAAQMGIERNALRIRAHRIRNQLQLCMEHCLGEQV